MTDLTIAKPTLIINTQEYSRSQILALHLLPGALMMVVFSLMASLTRQQGWLVIGIPFELAFLLYPGWKQNGRLCMSC